MSCANKARTCTSSLRLVREPSHAPLVLSCCRALRAPWYFYFFKLSNFTRLFLPDHFTHIYGVPSLRFRDLPNRFVDFHLSIYSSSLSEFLVELSPCELAE